MLEDGVGNAQVAFGVFEVDRVDLVRHGRGADFTGDSLLLEVTQRNVAPHIAIEVEQDGVKAGNRIKQLGNVVVRLDLGGVGVEGQAQVALDKGAGVGFPVHVRIGGQVGVVVADRTVDLAQQFNAFYLPDLA